MKSEILFIQRYPKHGYVVRTELVENPDPTGDPIKMRNAYNLLGDYIGDRETAKVLCEEHGIRPETISPDHTVCSIGFCEKEQKWYGWSHRAIFGFGIGSRVKKGDCGYTPYSVEELAKEYERGDDSTDVIDGMGEWSATTLNEARQMAIDFANGVAR